jgi:hypothetical protein
MSLTQSLTQKTQGPNDRLDYVVNWVEELGVDTISTSTFTVDSPGGLGISSPSNTTTTATIWINGGALDTEYVVTNRIVTAGGRTEEKKFRMLIKHR